MSLLNLLTVGNSFSTVEDHPSPYRMTQEKLLPRFGPDEFGKREGTLPAPDQTTSNQSAVVATPSLFEQTQSRESALVAEREPERAITPATDPIVNSGNAYPEGRWTFRKALSIISKPERQDAAPVQCELPWENIPVMRNDLNDTDVEVVRSKPALATKSVKQSDAADRPKAKPLLNRITSRLFRSDKVRSGTRHE